MLSSSEAIRYLNSEYSGSCNFWPEPLAKMNFTSSHEEAKVEDVARGEQTAVKATALTAPIEKAIVS